MLVDAAILVAGLIVLTVEAELLVRGASRLALRLGMSPLLVGLTVVSLATSAPELAVVSGALLDGDPDLAVGNVVGSNIANVLLILGLVAVVAPLPVQRRILRVEAPVLIGVSALVLFLAADGTLVWFEGGALLLGLVLYMVFIVRAARRNGVPQPPSNAGSLQPVPSLWVCGALIVVGLGLLVVAARLVVVGAVGIATDLGLSELFIGLTVVAIGTSVPEIAATTVAAVRGERDLAVGNVVGSTLLVAGYGAYVTYTVLAATEHDAQNTFAWMMGGLVLPTVAVLLLVAVVRSLRNRTVRRAQS